MTKSFLHIGNFQVASLSYMLLGDNKLRNLWGITTNVGLPLMDGDSHTCVPELGI